jgi:hypothetical protein
MVVLVDRTTGQEVRRLKLRGEPAGLILVVFSGDGLTLLACPRQAPAAEAWDVEAGQRLAAVSLPSSPRSPGSRQLALSDDGRWLAVVPDPVAGSAIELIEVGTGAAGQRFTVPGTTVHGVAFAPDGRRLAVGTKDGAVYQWDLTTGTALQPFRGHRALVASVAYAPGGRRLASGSVDGTGLIWDVTPPAAEPIDQPPPVGVLWNELIGADAGAAHRAGFALAAQPAAAVTLLAERLTAVTAPAPAADAKDIDRWLADLDADKYATRAQARANLERAGVAAAPAVRRALAANPTAEARTQLAALLARLAGPAADDPTRRAVVRGVAVLERIGTPAARKTLTGFASRTAKDELSQESAAAVRRLDHRPTAAAP